MLSSASRLTLFGALVVTVLVAPCLSGQTPTCNGLPATIVATTPGVINGTQGDDVIVGTPGDDRIFGLGGNDTLLGQEGNDTFFWSPGDGSDRIEGSSGTDSLVMAGANINETVGLSANGTRLRLTRDVANIVLDAAGIERVSFAARGGSDLITVASLVGTGVQQVTLELEGVDKSNTPDGLPDSVIVFGTSGDDQITLTGSGNVVNTAGAGPAIQIRNPEPALDTLSVQGVEGNDRIDAHGLAAGLVKLTIEGGPGKDTIQGSAGADSLVGGEDDDTFEWPLATPADLIGGEAGNDTLVVIGSNAANTVTFSAGALDAQVLNNADGVTFATDVENIVFQAMGGADQITVNMLASAPLQRITLDLRATPTSTTGDSSRDAIVVNGTPNADNISIAGSAGSLTVSGLAPTVVVQGSESLRDTLVVNGGPGDDVINAQNLAADTIRLTLRGGQGSDVVTGSAGDDVVAWFPGDGSDTIDGGAGNDLLQISGANINESISLSANGSRLRFTRDVASIVLDATAVERVAFAALGGTDNISIGDLNATAVRQVALDLGAFGNSAGDGQPDTITIAPPPGTSLATAVGAGTMSVFWSAVRISATGVEPGVDRLVVQQGAGATPIVAADASGTSQ